MKFKIFLILGICVFLIGSIFSLSENKLFGFNEIYNLSAGHGYFQALALGESAPLVLTHALEITGNATISEGLEIEGGLIVSANGSIIFANLTSCDRIQSDSSGLLSCGTGVVGNVSSLDLLSVYKSGTQATTVSFSDLTGWTQDISDDPYSFNITSGVITFDESGRYLVSVDSKINGATDRSTLSLRVAEDFGSGFTFDTRKVWVDYVVRNAANSEGGIGGIYIKDYSVGDKIKLQVKAADTQNNIATNDSRIFIIKMQGSTGASGTDGTDGTDGSTGATGAGSNIIVQKDNVTIGTVTDTLNFEGSAVSVIDVGNNKTTVTISGVAGNIFGSEFEFFESLSESTTGNALINKLSVSTAIKPAGTYRIGFFADATNADGTDLTDIQFLVDGSPIAQHTSGKDLYTMVPHQNNDWLSFSAVQYKVLSTSTTISLNIKFGTNDNTAKISNAIIEIWRVS